MHDFTYFFSLRLHLMVSEKPVSTTEIVLSVTENTTEQKHNLVNLAVTTTATVTVTQSTQPDQKDCYGN
jgi:small neutral amino acid transporter SnatA (MarC family)